jgi:hypothetical protein
MPLLWLYGRGTIDSTDGSRATFIQALLNGAGNQTGIVFQVVGGRGFEPLTSVMKCQSLEMEVGREYQMHTCRLMVAR